jgi:hypothetical protein
VISRSISASRAFTVRRRTEADCGWSERSRKKKEKKKNEEKRFIRKKKKKKKERKKERKKEKNRKEINRRFQNLARGGG